MNVAQSGTINPAYLDPRAPVNAAMPRRSEVDRLSSALDRLDKTLSEHAGRLDNILRPTPPAVACGNAPSLPESRLASEVSRLDHLCERLAALTDRIEA